MENMNNSFWIDDIELTTEMCIEKRITIEFRDFQEWIYKKTQAITRFSDDGEIFYEHNGECDGDDSLYFEETVLPILEKSLDVYILSVRYAQPFDKPNGQVWIEYLEK